MKWLYVLVVTAFFADVAHADDATDACFAPVVESLRQRGARPVAEQERGFLMEGESAVHEEVVGADGQCVGFLALGGKQVRDLDLALFTNTGTSLVEDVATDSHPYVRFCGAANLALRVVVRMYQGRGEYRLLRIDNAPLSLERLDTLLGACAGPASAGTAEALADVGPEPLAGTFDAHVEQTIRAWRERGYIPTERGLSGQVAQGRNAQHRLDLGQGDCYAVLAIGDAGIQDLDLTVLAMNHGRAFRDGTRERDAAVTFCADETHHTLDVRAYRGAGNYRIVTMRMMDDPAFRGAQLQGASRVLANQWAFRASARGLRTRIEQWASVAPSASLSLPVLLRAGACYALGAVPGPEMERGDLDVVVTDTHDNLLTWDVGPDNEPMAFRCPTQDETVRVVVRLTGAARSRALVLVATDQGSEP